MWGFTTEDHWMTVRSSIHPWIVTPWNLQSVEGTSFLGLKTLSDESRNEPGRNKDFKNHIRQGLWTAPWRNGGSFQPGPASGRPSTEYRPSVTIPSKWRLHNRMSHLRHPTQVWHSMEIIHWQGRIWFSRSSFWKLTDQYVQNIFLLRTRGENIRSETIRNEYKKTRKDGLECREASFT